MSAQKISICSCCNKALIAPTSSKHLNKSRSGRCFFLFTSSQTSWLISYPLANIQRKRLDEKQGNTKSVADVSKGIKSFFFFLIRMTKTVAVPVHPWFQCKIMLGVALSNQQCDSAVRSGKLHSFPKWRVLLGFGFLFSFYFWTSVEGD